jgi:1-acyl-sn-glycerol-3-phosphate acyltransferase
VKHDPTIPRPWAVSVVRLLSKALIIRRYGIASRGSPGIDPPYILVSNHVNYWDPFFIGALLPDTVQFVTSDNIFRSRLIGTVMRLLASIPKTKFMPDGAAVRRIFTVLRKNRGVVGIFPEGRRTWDGMSIPPMPEVPRLVKAAGVPVVLAKQSGGYLAQPRWARYRSRGPVAVGFSLLLSREAVAALGTEEISARISAAVEHDDAEWSAGIAAHYRNRAPAEYLERLLFVCPGCRGFSTLVSRREYVTCTACGLSHRYRADGRFVAAAAGPSVGPPVGPPRFGTPGDWNRWQVDELARRMEAARETGFGVGTGGGGGVGVGTEGGPGGGVQPGPQTPLFADQGVRLLTGYRSAKVRRRDVGTLRLDPGGIALEGKNEWLFSFGEIEGVNVQNTEALEFYRRGRLFRFEQPSPRSNAYKWLRAIQLGQELLTPAVPQSGP